MPELIVEKLFKRFGHVVAVDHISFTVRDGEFLTLLGPSGCGKSTTLAAIAGLDQPDGGVIRVGETIFFDAATGRNLVPERRNCGLVFQSYALWPHMTVAENLAFPLKLRKIPKGEQEQRIHETLKLVELEAYTTRYPHELSGGQQQRVALARALVYNPSILLLDEPLSNLDAKLRERARVWLKHLQSQVGITTVYVTHDQIEALALSDRIAVMREGRIDQLGSPQDIYERPATPFVADFIGTSNFLRAHVVGVEKENRLLIELLSSRHRLWIRSEGAFTEGTPIVLAVRPEKILVLTAEASAPSSEGNVLETKVAERSYLGARYQYQLVLSEEVIIRAEALTEIEGKTVCIWIPSTGCAVFTLEELPPPIEPSLT